VRGSARLPVTTDGALERTAAAQHRRASRPVARRAPRVLSMVKTS